MLDFFIIFWPLILVDVVRSVGKSFVLCLNAAYLKLKKPQSTPDFSHQLSLIIPAHNEEALIVQSIDSALEADYPDKEIIVVDDGSTDRTFELASSYSKAG